MSTTRKILEQLMAAAIAGDEWQNIDYWEDRLRRAIRLENADTRRQEQEK